jgi:translation initiation factor IF-2
VVFLTEQTGQIQKKKRVYELARELNLSSEALVKILTDLGIDAKSHMSAIDAVQEKTVLDRFDEEKKAALNKAAQKKTVKRRRRKKKATVSAETVKTVKSNLAQIESGTSRGGKKKRRRYKEEKQERHELRQGKQEDEKKLRVPENTSPAELAEQMGVPVSRVIASCMGLGVMVTANQRLDTDAVSLLAAEFGFEVETVKEFGAEALEEKRLSRGGERSTRPPVVTIMGHVDHGKTALLDRIRSTNVISTESGGITQHIGAYVSTLDNGSVITFIDTPGHQAFTAMRARGALITDIVILVVASDSRVMPQTQESIDHAKAAGIPILVAITKMDLPTANPEFIKQDLANRGVLVEEWSGSVQCAQVSALTGEGISDLLEKILLQAELLELDAVPDRPARGTVLEGRMDPRRGSVVNLLIQDGTLRDGDFFVAGQYCGRTRALYDENENQVESVGPGYPVQLLGTPGVPEAGDSFVVVESEQEARRVALRRQLVEREKDLQARRRVTLQDFWAVSGDERVLNIVLKADFQGSAEAIVDSLQKLQTEEVSVAVIHSGTGGINESDVDLAVASNAVILGFRVRPDARARERASSQGIEISTFSVIYDIEDTVRKALSGLLRPEEKEQFLGSAEVRETFKVPKAGTIAGCYVMAGMIKRNARIRLVRDGVIVHEGSICSLKHFKEDKREISAGFECGIGVAGYGDIKVGDIIESYEIIQIAREL